MGKIRRCKKYVRNKGYTTKLVFLEETVDKKSRTVLYRRRDISIGTVILSEGMEERLGLFAKNTTFIRRGQKEIGYDGNEFCL